jgi:hypothetical protein
MTAPPYSETKSGLSTNFTGWNASATVAYARKFVAKLTDHPDFPEPWPLWVASLAKLTDKCNVLEAVTLDAESHDKYQVAKRNALNDDLKKDLRSSILHVDLAAQGNTLLIKSLGLNERHGSVKRSIPPAMLAPLLTATQAKESGTLSIKISKCPGALMNELQITEGDPTVEESWPKGDFFSQQTFLMKNRVPGKTYYLRARCLGRSGTGPWSHIVTIISL